MIDWTMIGTVTGVLVAVSALFLWVLRTILEPIKQLIRANTEAVRQVVEKLDDHEGRLRFVENRVAVYDDRDKRVDG